MFNELDTVVLTSDQTAHGLCAGDVGAIVCVHGNGIAFDVEFCSGSGKTLALLTLSEDDIRHPGENEILCVRDLSDSSSRNAFAQMGLQFWDNPLDDAAWNSLPEKE